MNDIKHTGVMLENGHVHYLCNFACGLLGTKIASQTSKVTCKNCLKILKHIKNGIDMQEYIKKKKRR